MTKKRWLAFLTAVLLTCSSSAIAVFADDPPAKPDGDESGGGSEQGGGGSGGGGSSAPTEWDADLVYTASDNNTESTAYTPSVSSSGADTNAILNNGGTIWLENVTASRTGSSSTGGDDASFYGIGATFLTVSGTSYIDGAEIQSSDAGGAGIFSYDAGVTYVRNANINTTANTSGGIHAAGGGTLYAYNVNATTAGQSSAALRSDRGGGTMIVEGGSFTSNGTRSPAVYCTADITVADAVLTATKSEGICIEGLNSLALFDCELTGNAPSESENENLTWGVILYQSMSGDSSVGNSEFYMEGGSLACTANGSVSTLFFNTNTESTITLNDVSIDTSADFNYALLVSGFSRWGSTGSNGADCTFTCIQQELDGNVGWDSISELDFYLTDGSVLTGAVVNDNSFGNTSSGSGYCTIAIDSDSSWVCTGNSTVTNLYNAGAAITDVSGQTVTIIADGNIVVPGTSAYTITVTGTYGTTDNTSGAVSASDYTYKPYATWNPWSADDDDTDTTNPTEATTEATTEPIPETTAAAEETTDPTETTTGTDRPAKPGETDDDDTTPPDKPSDDSVQGDVNGDGAFTILDLVAMQKYLLGQETTLSNWRAGDLLEDEKLNIYDFCAMKRLFFSTI